MTAPCFTTPPRRLAFGTAASLWLVLSLFSQTAAAADVLVITDSRHPVQPTAGMRVIELDLPSRIEAELATGLPSDPAKAAVIVQQRLRDGGQELQSRIGRAYQGVTDAWSVGVAKVPAVVVDRRYVVYGDPNVAAAVARIEAHRRFQP